jgi:hypothetical protein
MKYNLDTCDESIVQIKQQEKTLIDAITKHSQERQNEIEFERKSDFNPIPSEIK